MAVCYRAKRRHRGIPANPAISRATCSRYQVAANSNVQPFRSRLGGCLWTHYLPLTGLRRATPCQQGNLIPAAPGGDDAIELPGATADHSREKTRSKGGCSYHAIEHERSRDYAAKLLLQFLHNSHTRTLRFAAKAGRRCIRRCAEDHQTSRTNRPRAAAGVSEEPLERCFGAHPPGRTCIDLRGPTTTFAGYRPTRASYQC